MIKIDKTEVFGFEAAIRGMRNPMNSWDKSDSGECYDNCDKCPYLEESILNHGVCFYIGDNDRELAKKLVKAGSDHRKFMRMIHVQADVLAPIYFWKEYDTYKVGTVANSCSTMHTIHKKEFTLDDFSHEHLISDGKCLLENLIEALNEARSSYLNYDELANRHELDDEIKSKKDIWWQIIQLLPSSYNQLRTIDLNYEVLYNIYHARKNHKLDEWSTFCSWIEKLPYMSDFLGLEEKNEEEG
jgi:hypothetical protein